jgi:hypothetical protein
LTTAAKWANYNRREGKYPRATPVNFSEGHLSRSYDAYLRGVPSRLRTKRTFTRFMRERFARMDVCNGELRLPCRQLLTTVSHDPLPHDFGFISLRFHDEA